jgi:hypothetical protein
MPPGAPVPARGDLVGEVIRGGDAAPLPGALAVEVELEFGVTEREHHNSSRSVVLAVLDSSREGAGAAWGRSPIFAARVPQLRVLGE